MNIMLIKSYEYYINKNKYSSHKYKNKNTLSK